MTCLPDNPEMGMKVFDLRCALDHRFEGWFASESDYESQRERGLLTCPLCNDAGVTRLPSASRLSLGTRAAESAAAPGASDLPATAGTTARPVVPAAALQAAWMQAVRHVLAHTEDVGDRFVEQARDMHQGRIESRAIRGQATPEQAAELREEGVEVVALPIPKALEGPLQ